MRRGPGAHENCMGRESDEFEVLGEREQLSTCALSSASRFNQQSYDFVLVQVSSWDVPSLAFLACLVAQILRGRC